MVEIIAGDKGSGKTQHLLDKAHEDLKAAQGDIIYIDKSAKQMYKLDRNIRLINMADFLLSSTDEFLGFLSGAISQNSDIEEICLDSFRTVAFIEDNEGLKKAIEKLDIISEKFSIKFVLCIDIDDEDLPESVKAKIIVNL